MKKAEEEESETEQALLESMDSAKRVRTDRNLKQREVYFSGKTPIIRLHPAMFVSVFRCFEPMTMSREIYT